jgi:hypothetical protein
MRLTIHARVLATLIGCCLIWSLSNCAGPKEAEKQPAGGKVQVPPAVQQAPPVPPPPKKEPTYFIRTVTWPNESLSIIAAWYTGQIDNWKILVEANPELDPTRIRIGDKVRIPAELVKTREPMSQEFVESLVPKPVKKGAPPPKQKPSSGEPSPPPAAPEIKLYGPKS